MPGTFRIARIFGIDISLHWSWAFIFALVTWTFAEGILDTTFPEWGSAQRWIVGAVVALVFFSSILLHELSHSVVARRFGIPVSSITLFVFGGVSNLRKEPESARQEFLIAVVGPLTSFGMAAVYGIGYLVLHGIETGVADVSANLAFINAAIGVFNLIPGFPLDGGRVLRSVFWARDRNILDATRLASRIGEYVAYTFMGIGFLMFFFVDVISGIWLFLIGNFLRGASAASYEQVFVDSALRGVPATVVVRHDYVAISPDQTIDDLVQHYFLAGHGRCLPVMAGDELLGIVTLSDVRKVPRDDWKTATAHRCMTPAAVLKTVGPGDDLAKVLALMATNGLNQIPVMERRLLLGLIERSDIISYIQIRQAIGASVATS